MGRKITDPQEIEALFRLLNRMADGYEATEEEAAELEEIIEIEINIFAKCMVSSFC